MAGDVDCRRPGCGDYYTDHQDGGECLAGPNARDGRGGDECSCPGFQWVDPQPAPGENAGYARAAQSK